jgi:MYXO-CTERM domain-containing protein
MRYPLRSASVSVVLGALFVSPTAIAATLQAGPGKTYATPCAAIAAAQPGDTIEVDAGTYDGDTCAWSKDNLTVRAVGGRAKIDMTGKAVTQKKGIFVITAPNATVEGFELSGAAISVADGKNGAGIRHQGLNLTVRDCVFHDNQDGILGGPLANGMNADGQGEVLIERSEFYNNGVGDGLTHNMYLNHYAKFTLRFSYSHASDVGHLVKSRAVESHILYNRLSDDASTNVSYEVNLPNGGRAFIIGNLIEQGPDPNGQENGAIIDFGSEGPMAGSDLFVVNNTIVNKRMAGGTFVKITGVTTPAILRNNIFVGNGTICNQANAVLDHNFSMGDPMLADAQNLDLHLLPGSPCVDMGVDPGMGDGQSLVPQYHYVHPTSFETRTAVGAIDIGAYELGGGGGAGGGGAGGGSASSSSGTASSSSGMASSSSGMASSSSGGEGGSAGVGGSGGANGNGGDGAGSGDEGGCGCRTAGDGASGGALAMLALAGLLVATRRRTRT